MNEPETYKQFLEILHTYQKEQRGIKDVLEQVSALFADHPDLLKEFTYFLPDAVQEQAKERLNRAAADSERRRAVHQSPHYGGATSVYGNQHDFYLRQKESMQQALTGGYNSTSYKYPGSSRKQHAHRGYTPKIIDMTKPLTKAKKAARQSYNDQSRGGGSHQQASPMVYNAGVERQFFDKVRDTMTSSSRDGGAWGEFLKCLDMYSQEVLSRSEMLQLVEDLFGKHHDLFQEFKSILSASASNDVIHDDTWYSVPLSEIDFSRCRKCGPSYRALPRDYPNPPCSERAPYESDVLNNVWVSLPVGSEESYTFRHMRKNQYEEALFRCEDERFEIDMVIDSNHSTMRVLEPIVEEIKMLSRQEFMSPSLSTADYAAAKNTGAGGIRFQYKFDMRTLSTTHTNAITRIYGDHAQDILHLLEKNPTKSIPTIYSRLKQKDVEFRAARNHLNKRWKELADHNYQKSLDHRSFYFRQADKKLTGTKALINELINAAVVKQPNEGKKQQGHAGPGPSPTPPPPPPKIFRPPPHLTATYPSDCAYAHRDAFKLIMFAVEKSQLSPSDKERAGRMWRDFLGPLFSLDTTWLYSDVNRDGSGEMVAGADVDDTVAIPVGALVATMYGEGVIKNFEHGKYTVKLNYGVGKFQPNAVYCSILPVEKSTLYEQYSSSDSNPSPPGIKCVLGTSCLYVFLRLHCLIVSRLVTARKLSSEMSGEAQVTHPHVAMEEIPESETTSSPRHIYQTFLTLLYNNLESHGDNNKYEVQCRQLLGSDAYKLYTMDKLVVHAYKQLKAMGDDAILHHFIQIFRRYNSKEGTFKVEAMKLEGSHWSNDEVFKVVVGRENGGHYVEFEYKEALNNEVESGSEEEDVVGKVKGGRWGKKRKL